MRRKVHEKFCDLVAAEDVAGGMDLVADAV
jgi:hypothetical protein